MPLFWLFAGKMYRVRLDSVVYVLDADDISAKLDAQDADAVAVTNQLRCADVVLLNKVDLIEPEALAAVRAKLVETVPDLQVVECSFGNVPLSAILEIHESGRGESVSPTAAKNKASRRPPTPPPPPMPLMSPIALNMLTPPPTT